MSDAFGAYSFLPWLRQGVARTLTQVDGDETVRLRATARVELKLTGQSPNGSTVEGQITRDVELYGPGEVIGIESRAIVRTEPRPWITNVEPNYLAHIEFYDEDFPWRYTPTAPFDSRRKIRPWITLVVLKDTGDPATAEFREARALADRPLGFITLKDFAPFPAPLDLWAWAHVHADQHLGTNFGELVPTDLDSFVQRLEATLASNPDRGHSRLVCPRRLEENAAYHGFLVPTFERGRLAGLGMDPDLAPFATASAWENYTDRPESFSMPYYHRWYFRTGGVGDFESLVRLLQFKTADPKVGRRDMDVQAPGSNIPGILDAQLHGVLRLGGALRAPKSTLSESGRAEFELYENWAKSSWPHPFQEKLAKFINLAESFLRTPADQARTAAELPPTEIDDVDPLITPPIYGEWHALQHRLLTDAQGAALVPNDNWIHEINLDPRHRVAAGFGGDVVRKHQEEYMEAAWKQVGEVLAHNQKARVAQTWLQVLDVVHTKALKIVAAEPSRVLAFTGPVQRRLMHEGVTVRHARELSLTPAVLTSPTMRRVARPRGPLARRLSLSAGPHTGKVLEAVNEGVITPAPPKKTPPGIATVESIAEAVATAPTWPPEWLRTLARGAAWLRRVLGAVALVLIILAIALGGLAFLLLLAAAAALAAILVLELARRQPTVDEALGKDLDTESSVNQLGPGPNFVFGATPASGASPGLALGSLFAADNPAARRFKFALKDWAVFAEAATLAGRELPRRKLDLARVANSAVETLRPSLTLPRRFLAATVIAPHIRNQIVEVFDEIKYYPRIDEAMYRPLKELSDEHFVPNLNLIEPDSVVALETNQDFIEAYMVGVNHEFSRELLWREYPTDLRGSCFRQFWDVFSHFNPEATDSERDTLYDIPAVHTWPRASKLGEHDHRQPNPGVERDEIVLAIRGELLKKYPNTVVYAHAAQWVLKDGVIDPSRERELVPLSDAEVEKPPRVKLRMPLYDAKVDPDIYFFGFDLTAEDARGGTGENNSDPPGWFFVLKERPGEPRFGLDVARPSASPIVTVNDLAWSDTGVSPGGLLSAGALGTIALTPPSAARDDLEKQPQHDDDKKVVPEPQSSARFAYLLFQSPVMVAVHAAELLKSRAE